MLEQIDMFGGAPAVRAVQPCKPCPATIKATTAAIGSMRAGERRVYHTGMLARDRMTDAILGGAATAYSKAADAGQVVLSQRRLAANRYEYVATKKKL